MRTLENLKDLAYRAHTGTSFSPEKRAESIINDYSSELDQDIEKIKSLGASDEQVERYKTGYIAKLSAWLGAKSNCISTMIAGPANFPVRRAEKANNSERSKQNDFILWREKVLKAYERYNRKKAITEAGGELEIAKQKLEGLKKNHELMKEGNKRISAANKNGEDISEYLTITFNIAPHMIDWTMKFGFGLSNSLAKIKATESRIKELERKEEKKESGENKEFLFNGGVCVIDYQLDRITLKHDQKPDSETIKAIKEHGFRWSPHYSVWMRKITNNAIWSTNRLLQSSSFKLTA